jgi:hypothetical protein
VGSNYVAQLWYGPDQNSLTAVAPVASFREIPLDSPLAGVWRGDARTLDGFTQGDLVILQVRVWDISLFSTSDEASSSPGAILGASDPFSYRVPPFGALEGYRIANFRSFAPVPEPSVLLLTPLLLTILLFRDRVKARRKSIVLAVEDGDHSLSSPQQ